MTLENPAKQKTNANPVTIPDAKAGDKSFSLAHISDPHMAFLDNIKPQELFNKRMYGYINWKLRRAAEHREDIITVLLSDLRETDPDHIAVTGDLTNLGLPIEFQKTKYFLRSLGAPSKVTVVPGNHDTYIQTDWESTFTHWVDYMVSDNAKQPAVSATGFSHIFPSLRVRGSTALIGVCSARPSPIFLAIGSIGSNQLKKLARVLEETGKQGLFRIILIHHPPVSGIVSSRKRLTDALEFRSAVARYGVELVLCGHAHRTTQGCLKTPAGVAPVIGLPSVSALGHKPQRRARYNIYRITPKTNGWEVLLSTRILSPDKKRFIAESKRHFILPSKQ